MHNYISWHLHQGSRSTIHLTILYYSDTPHIITGNVSTWLSWSLPADHDTSREESNHSPTSRRSRPGLSSPLHQWSRVAASTTCCFRCHTHRVLCERFQSFEGCIKLPSCCWAHIPHTDIQSGCHWCLNVAYGVLWVAPGGTGRRPCDC